jgi:hypothetical protein
MLQFQLIPNTPIIPISNLLNYEKMAFPGQDNQLRCQGYQLLYMKI